MDTSEERKGEARHAPGLALVDSLRQDVTYALRALRKSPAFSAVAILSLALGIGANTTIFTFVNAVLLRPLPYPESERIVTLRERVQTSGATVNVHPANFVEWHARARSFEALALVQTPPLTVLSANGAEQIQRAQITSDLFRVFGVAPVFGRDFTLEETRPGPDDVVILGHGFWQRWFGGDPGVIGRQLAVREGPATIVGIAPAGFRIGLTEPEVFSPLKIDPARPGAIGARSFQSYGRLKPGVSLAGAQAEMSAIASDLVAGAARPARQRGIRRVRIHAARLSCPRGPSSLASPHGGRRDRARYRVREPDGAPDRPGSAAARRIRAACIARRRAVAGSSGNSSSRASCCHSSAALQVSRSWTGPRKRSSC